MSEKKENQEMDPIAYAVNRIENLQRLGHFEAPKDYHAGNAVKAAWDIIKNTKGGKDANYKPALEICNKNSIMDSLIQMVTEGLNAFKSQCAFIVRKVNNEFHLTYQRMYAGNILLAKRMSGVKRIDSQVVFKDDKIQYQIEDGIMSVAKHERGATREHKDIIGAYAVVTESDGTKVVFEMTMNEIQDSWSQGSMNGKGDVHTKFSDEMAKKTVTNRACKNYINTSDDEYLHKHYEPEEKESLEMKKPALEIKVKESKAIEPVNEKLTLPQQSVNTKVEPLPEKKTNEPVEEAPFE
jgi:recombination protein RecT